MNRRSALALALLALCVEACADPTELMLIVKSTPGLSAGPGGDIDALHVRVQPANGEPQVFTYARNVALCGLSEQGKEDCRPQRYAEADYDKALTLPVRFLLEPGNVAKDELVRVWVDAQLGSKVRIANGLTFRFSPGRRLWLEIPLYRDCLGVIECQPADRICGVGRVCTEVLPTLEPPPDVDTEPNDLAGLLNPVDAAQACGMAGIQCCEASTCLGNASCNAEGYCIDPTVTCGQQGQPCCAPGASCLGALVCSGGTCETACGDTSQACCAGVPACNKGADKCISGVCQACGEVGQQCCPGPTCFDLDVICDSNNTCVGCGGLGQLCCDKQVCFNGTCDVSSVDMQQPEDASTPKDMVQSVDFSTPPPDFGFPPDSGTSFDLMSAGSSFQPLGGAVPVGPPKYCF